MEGIDGMDVIDCSFSRPVDGLILQARRPDYIQARRPGYIQARHLVKLVELAQLIGSEMRQSVRVNQLP